MVFVSPHSLFANTGSALVLLENGHSRSEANYCLANKPARGFVIHRLPFPPLRCFWLLLSRRCSFLQYGWPRPGFISENATACGRLRHVTCLTSLSLKGQSRGVKRL